MLTKELLVPAAMRRYSYTVVPVLGMWSAGESKARSASKKQKQKQKKKSNGCSGA